jgi:hypothetical protein
MREHRAVDLAHVILTRGSVGTSSEGRLRGDFELPTSEGGPVMPSGERPRSPTGRPEEVWSSWVSPRYVFVD